MSLVLGGERIEDALTDALLGLPIPFGLLTPSLRLGPDAEAPVGISVAAPLIRVRGVVSTHDSTSLSSMKDEGVSFVKP